MRALTIWQWLEIVQCVLIASTLLAIYLHRQAHYRYYLDVIKRIVSFGVAAQISEDERLPREELTRLVVGFRRVVHSDHAALLRRCAGDCMPRLRWGRSSL